MNFCKKWLRNHQKILLNFLIHIDVLMLCSKFELILTSIFQVTAILRKCQNLKKSLYYSRGIFSDFGSFYKMAITRKIEVGINSNLLHSISTSICFRKCNKKFW